MFGKSYLGAFKKLSSIFFLCFRASELSFGSFLLEPVGHYEVYNLHAKSSQYFAGGKLAPVLLLFLGLLCTKIVHVYAKNLRTTNDECEKIIGSYLIHSYYSTHDSSSSRSRMPN